MLCSTIVFPVLLLGHWLQDFAWLFRTFGALVPDWVTYLLSYLITPAVLLPLQSAPQLRNRTEVDPRGGTICMWNIIYIYIYMYVH